MHPDGGIGRTRAARDEGDARPPGERAIGTGHEGDATFLSAHHQIDFGRVVQRIEHREEAFAGDGENAVAALRDELVDQDTAASAGGRG